MRPSKVTELGKDVAMQIARHEPRLSWTRPTSDQATLDKEKEILLAQMAKEDPKNANQARQQSMRRHGAWASIGKYYEENCLLQQAFVKENKVSVEKHVAEVAKQLGGKITVKAFTRFADRRGHREEGGRLRCRGRFHDQVRIGIRARRGPRHKPGAAFFVRKP